MRTTATGLLLLLLCVAPGLAQQRRDDLILDIEKRGITRVKIAVPDPPGGNAEALELARVIRGDLEFSGFFDVVEPSLYRLVEGSTPADVKHEEWLSIGADATVLLGYMPDGDRIRVEARLYSNPDERNVLAKRYGGGLELLRRVAHQVSDDLVLHYTGRPGIAKTRIAFVSKYGDGKEIYVMDYDGRRVRRLTSSKTVNLSPVWSPDAKRLAYLSWRGRQPGVYVIESSGKRTKVSVLRGELTAAPEWSPDGRQLAYSSDADGNSEIYVVELGSNRHTRLTRHGAIETAPAWSPNGREIAFTSDRSGTPQVYVMDGYGLNVRRVSFDSSYSESPAWSPSGDRLAYVSRNEGRFDVMVLDIASGELTRLTRGEGNNENPRWSPDGRHLVFASNRAGTYDIYTMHADGSGVRRLTRGVDSFTPDWSR